MPEFSTFHGLAASAPIAVLLVALIARNWSGAKAGGLALAVAVIVAMLVFGAGVSTIAVAAGKAAVLALWVLSIVWTALFLYHLVNEAGRIQDIGLWLGRWAPTGPFLILLLGWAFTSLLQGVAGYGVPVAVVAPLLVSNGIAPVVAVVAASIGHAWSVTFGSLAASYVALTGVTGIVEQGLASDAALLLGAVCVLSGIGAVLSFGGPVAVRGVAMPIAVVGGAMALVQWGVATSGAPSIAALSAGATGVAMLAAWGRWEVRRKKLERGPRVDVRDFLAAFSPYLALLAIVIVVALAEPVSAALDFVRIETPFPETSTATGWTNPATSSYRTIVPLAETASLLVYAALAGFLVYRSMGVATSQTLFRAAARTRRGAMSSSLGVIAMVAMALAMADSGMTYALASMLAEAAGPAYPAIAPFLGLLGGFVTGSNTNSNILFGVLQRDSAVLLALPTTVILAAQTAGGAIGSIISPTKIIVASSTVGLGGRESTVMRSALVYGICMTLVVGLLAQVVSSVR